MEKIIGIGAEAIIYKINNKIVKDRIKKSYRIPFLDEKIRKQRTKAEAKIIKKLEKIISVPKIIKTDEKQEIIMDYIEGKKLSDNLELLNYKKICKLIAENIAKIHNQGIIHGDLTTSNMIYVEDNFHESNAPTTQSKIIITDNKIINNRISSKLASKRSQQRREIKKTGDRNEPVGKVYFIDFGLAFHSNKIEDKAVDLHLLQQALEAKHFTIWQECYKIILDNYEKNANQGKEIIHRIKIIESRGRYKDKY